MPAMPAMPADRGQSAESCSSTSDPAWQIVDDTEPVEGSDLGIPDPAEESTALDLRRIERIATLHRAGRKSRSWAVVVILFSAIGAVDLAVEGARRAASGAVPAAVALGFTAVALGATGIAKFQSTRRTPTRPDATVSAELLPPDFEPLGDGSQRWRDCEQIR